MRPNSLSGMKNLLIWFRQTHVLQRTALLLAFVMMAHGFDTCSAHVAGVANFSKTASTPIAQAVSLELCGTAERPFCELCQPPEPRSDICEVTSETVTLPSGDGWELAPPVLINVPGRVVIPDIIDLMPVSIALLVCAGPDVSTLSSTLCRNPLLGRAPPLSA